MRGIFTAGVLDALAGIGPPPFDVVIGVSAGACCAASYLAGQLGRNRRIFVDHMTTRRFASLSRALLGGSFVDMDYIMGPVTFLLDPLDLEALRSSETDLEVVATDAATGEPRYLPGRGRDAVAALLATVAMPVFYDGGPVPLRGERLFDGGVADPVPVERALALGARDLTVVLTRPASWRAAPMSGLARLVSAASLSRYPGTLAALARRHEVYERVRAVLSAPPRGVALRVVRPPEGFPVARFTTDLAALDSGYAMGRRAGLELVEAL